MYLGTKKNNHSQSIYQKNIAKRLDKSALPNISQVFSIDFLDNLKKIMGRNHKSHMGSPYQSVFTFILMRQKKLDRFIKRANYLRPTIKLMAEISEN